MDEIFQHAVKLLARRDYTVQSLRHKLEQKFGHIPEDTIDLLLQKRFLNDARFAENIVAKRGDAHPARVLEELLQAGISRETAERAIAARQWPSLRDVLKAKMIDWRFHPPLQRREATRLFRALSRLGYEEEHIREELEQLHDQQ